MMIDSNTLYALVLGLWLVAPSSVRAQDGAFEAVNGPTAAYDASFASGRPHGYGDTEPVRTPSADHATVTFLNGLSSVGSAAWPTVRTYLWESCFAGHDLFSGFALSRPGHEVSDVVTFLLIIDKQVWDATSSAARQTTLLKTGEAFKSRLAELNLKGSLEIVLMSR